MYTISAVKVILTGLCRWSITIFVAKVDAWHVYAFPAIAVPQFPFLSFTGALHYRLLILYYFILVIYVSVKFFHDSLWQCDKVIWYC